jgi:hypothetical protein
MKLEVEEIKELDDGGALITLKIDEDAMRALASEGLLSILRREIRPTAEYHAPPIDF